MNHSRKAVGLRSTAGRCSVVIAAAAGLCTLLVACQAPAEQAEGSTNSGGSGGGLTVTDVAGREVSFDSKPERVILAEGRGLMAAAILDKANPAEHVVSYGTDLHAAAPEFEAKLFAANPDIAKLPTVGNIAKGDVSVENLLASKPDVVVMTLDHKKSAEESGFLTKMDQAGLKYVFTDFRQKPLENTTKSMTLLGGILDEADKAQEFNDFYEQKVEDIKKRAAAAPDKPRTLLWRAAGLKDCCSTVKQSNLGDLVNAAGGMNLGDELLAGPEGDVTAEKVVTEQPEQIIATGGMWAKDPAKPEVLPHVELGYGAAEETAKATLTGLLDTPGFGSLKAPKDGNLHGVYHQFYDSPFNVFALEQFAQWLHPDQFADLDATHDFADFHTQWLPFDLDGTFFVTKDKDA